MNQVENSVEACGTPYTVDTGSGYAEVIQDCVYEVYLEYCNYTVEEWQVVDQVILQGSDRSPQWPNPQLEANERLGDTRESYSAIFSTDEGQMTYTFSDEDLYEQLIPRQPMGFTGQQFRPDRFNRSRVKNPDRLQGYSDIK